MWDGYEEPMSVRDTRDPEKIKEDGFNNLVKVIFWFIVLSIIGGYLGLGEGWSPDGGIVNF